MDFNEKIVNPIKNSEEQNSKLTLVEELPVVVSFVLR